MIIIIINVKLTVLQPTYKVIILPVTSKKFYVVFLSSPGHEPDARFLFPLLHGTIYCSFCRPLYPKRVKELVL